MVLTGLLGGLFVYWRMQHRLAQLRQENTRLQVTQESDAEHHRERLAALENAREQMSATFSALSGQALRNSNEEFLKLAQENLKQLHIKAQGEMDQKEKSIENLLKPLRETMEKSDRQIQLMEKERKEAYGALSKHLETLLHTQQALQGETRNLVQALRRPEVRGQWGEMTLRRLAELSGMVEYCDFYEQEHTRTDEGDIRPDMIIRMPGGREIVVDVKTPLDAYLNAMEAGDDETRNRHLLHHARKVRERVKELAGKAYWSQFKQAPDFVVLFIPGDQFLGSALEQDRELLEYSLQQKVVLATPTSFVALLRAVAYGWRQEALAENAERIRQIGEELHGRLATFSEHLSKLGRSLEASVSSYNRAVGSYDTRIMPSVRKFTELGLNTSKELGGLEQIEMAPKIVESKTEE
ncbi:MAG: recombinase RmuC [Gammaproteobacteria bacterium RBG_16_57_12]|nr:MAG: recombinase RmuC [Gammaproteobacteria bacterium RBG_16_57_12]